MKKNLRFILRFTAIALVVFLLGSVLWYFYTQQKIPKNVQHVTSNVLELLKPSVISGDYTTASVNCEKRELERVCESVYIFETKGTEGNLKKAVSSEDLKLYTLNSAKILRADGWKEYELRREDYPPEAFSHIPKDVEKFYFEHSKKNKGTDCTIKTSYWSRDPETSLSPWFSQEILCSHSSPSLWF